MRQGLAHRPVLRQDVHHDTIIAIQLLANTFSLNRITESKLIKRGATKNIVTTSERGKDAIAVKKNIF